MHLTRIRRLIFPASHAAARLLPRGSRRFRYASVLAAATFTATLTGSALAMASSGGRPARPPAPAPARAVPAAVTSQPGRSPITLATGQQVRLTPAAGGRSVVSMAPAGPSASRPGGASLRAAALMDTFQVSGDVYAVPGYALPYLGSRLDPRLFDVSYLQRAGYAGLKALPVSITWQHQAHAAIPGVAAPASGTRTTGSIALAAAGQFGQSIQASLRAAVGRGPAAARSAPAGPAPAAGAFAQIKKISLAPLRPAAQAPSAAQARPAAPGSSPLAGRPVAPAVPLSASSAPAGTRLYTLTIHALDRSGQPGYSAIAIQDLDHFERYYSVSSSTPAGPVQVSLPAGRYAIEAVIYDYGQQTGFTDNIAFVPVPEFTVSGDSSLTVDARQAKPVTVTVPRKAAPEMAGFSFTRTSADGQGLSGADYGFGPAVSSLLPPLRIYAKPTPAPSAGALGFADSWELQPPGTGLEGVDFPYTYNLDYASTRGVPATLSHTLTASDLAAVHENFDSSVAGAGAQTAATPFHSWSPLTFGLISDFLGPFPVPYAQTDYFGGSASTLWEQGVDLWSASGEIAPVTYGPLRTFRPGENVSMTWGASPSVPAPEWQDRGLVPGTQSVVGLPQPDYSYVCPVCRQGDVMSFNAAASGDADPTHTQSSLGLGSGFLSNTAGQPSDDLKFYRNGVLTQVSGYSGQVFPMLPGQASYKIDWASTAAPTWSQLATSEDSVWTFTSARPPAASKLPSYEACTPDVGQACSYLPLVFASYNFGANASGQPSGPGTETFTVTGYHERGDTGPAVDHASVQVSFDDGTTWAPASAVTAVGGGTFKVTVTPPGPSATSDFASVRVRLADAAGDTLDQTIIRAYELTSAPANAAAPAHGTGK